MKALPTETRWVIVGAGFAGAATAWALARLGEGPGVILEQEPSYGFHASGRNAAIIRLVEADSIIRTLASRSLGHIRRLDRPDRMLLRRVGGITAAPRSGRDRIARLHEALGGDSLPYESLTTAEAVDRFPALHGVRFDSAIWCPDEGVADIHALLTLYLQQAREGGFTLHTRCRACDLSVAARRVVGVETSTGAIRADAVVDASGAWAGRLGRPTSPLPLRALRRHLFVGATAHRPDPDAPFVWVEDPEFYVRPEGDAWLLSPCDETPMPPGDPPTDPAAAEMLAEKLLEAAPALADLAIRRSWACLRTFAPDRRPCIGRDPALDGLHHVSGLGGFGMTTSAALGELAADLLLDRQPDWIDPTSVAPSRDAVASAVDRR